jgi:hypothetical protein
VEVPAGGQIEVSTRAVISRLVVGSPFGGGKATGYSVVEQTCGEQRVAMFAQLR